MRPAPQHHDLAEQPVADRIQRGREKAIADLVCTSEVHTSTQCGRGGIVMPEEGIERAQTRQCTGFLARLLTCTRLKLVSCCSSLLCLSVFTYPRTTFSPAPSSHIFVHHTRARHILPNAKSSTATSSFTQSLRKLHQDRIACAACRPFLRVRH